MSRLVAWRTLTLRAGTAFALVCSQLQAPSMAMLPPTSLPARLGSPEAVLRHKMPVLMCVLMHPFMSAI